MASSVDLPAPFGPSRPTISPAVAGERDLRQRLAPAEVARDIDDGEAVEVARSRRRRLRLPPAAADRARRSRARARRSARCKRASSASDSGFCRRLRSSATISAQQLLALRRAASRPAPACAFAGEIANQAPTAKISTASAERDVARPLAVRRQAGQVQRPACRRRSARPPVPMMNGLAVRVHLARVGRAAATTSACCRSSRRATNTCASATGHFCRIAMAAPACGSEKPTCTEVLPGGNGPVIVSMSPCTLALRRRALHHRRRPRRRSAARSAAGRRCRSACARC